MGEAARRARLPLRENAGALAGAAADRGRRRGGGAERKGGRGGINPAPGRPMALPGAHENGPHGPMAGPVRRRPCLASGRKGPERRKKGVTQAFVGGR